MKHYFALILAMAISAHSFSQIAPGYEVATWHGFKKVAITYSFDDNTSNQIPVAVPILNTYGYKATFNVVTNWVGNNWSGWATLSTNGHEIASHTVSHASFTDLSTQQQQAECANSQSTIRTQTGSECITIAYPNCNVGNKTITGNYYIAARNCDGQIASNSPADFMSISSMICGSDGAIKTAQDFNSKISSAIANKGWCVFLIHGIDNDGGYSPLSSTVLNSHLSYVQTNESNYWVAPFATVAKYIKQRNALKLTESAITSDSLKLLATHSLTSSLTDYSTPITIKREVPTAWGAIAVYKNSTPIAASQITENGKKYVVFDVIPNADTYFLSNSESQAGSGNSSPEEGAGSFTELITNGEADNGTIGWNTQNNNSTQSTFSVKNPGGLSGANAFEICPNSGNYGTDDWHIQLYQNVDLEADKEYTFSFKARANTPRTITVMFQQLAESYEVYKAFNYTLNSNSQTFTETFTLSGSVDMASKVTFCVGGDPNCVVVDNISFGYSSQENGSQEPENPYIPPISGEGAYYTDQYRNLFAEYLGKTESEVQTKINNVWNHFFVNSTNKVYYESTNNTAYILDIGNNDVRSEGMSYGMMICVQLDKQSEFDKLWKWAKTYMLYTSGDWKGYFAWQCNTDGSKVGGNSTTCAPDGEAYFITSLFFASHRWGDNGTYNYQAEAQSILANIMNRPNTGTNSVYNMFHHSSKLITFVPYGDSYQHTDPSYNLPGFFELWARWSTTNTSFWQDAVVESRKLLKNSSHPITGLFPDYSSFNGQPFNPSWKTDYDAKRYQYDALRCALNVGMDYHWFRHDTTNQEQMMTKLLQFFKSKNYANGQYDWDGSNAAGSYSEGMAGANGVGVFALKDNNALATEYINKLWTTNPPSGQWRYYNGMVYFLSMLNCAGMFKVYKPAPTCTTPEAPTVSNADYCVGAQASPLSAIGNNILWYTTATGGIGSSTAPTPTTTIAGTTLYYASQTDGECESARTAIEVTVHNTPIAPIANAHILYALGEQATALEATGNELLWYNSSTGGIGNTIAPTPATNSIGSQLYYVSQTTNNCESPRTEIIVEIIESSKEQSIELHAGWNLVSIYLSPTSTYEGTICEGSNTNNAFCIHEIFANLPASIVKNESGFWKQGQIDAFQSLHAMQPHRGYLVYIDSPTTITIEGVASAGLYEPSGIGWQLIGFPYNNTTTTQAQPFEDYYNSNTCEMIKDFDGFWEPQGTLNSINQFEVNKAYFIKFK